MAKKQKRFISDIANTTIQAAMQEQSVAELLDEMRSTEDFTEAHPEAVRDFLDALEKAAREQAGHSVCRVTSAVALTDEDLKRIHEALAKKFDGTVSLDCTVDPNVIGGLAVACGEWRYQNTVQDKLKQLTKHLVSTR